jgi:hypothetical protein
MFIVGKFLSVLAIVTNVRVGGIMIKQDFRVVNCEINAVQSRGH